MIQEGVSLFMSLIKRYNVENNILKHFIKFYWFMESDSEISIDNKLLPVNNTDIIINYSSPVTYEKTESPLFLTGFILMGSEAVQRL